jgi:hypothetical protein
MQRSDLLLLLVVLPVLPVLQFLQQSGSLRPHLAPARNLRRRGR